MQETNGTGATAGIEVLRETIGKLEIGSALEAGRLQVFPLRQRDREPGAGGAAPPVLLCDALATGSAEVTEIDQHGSVPQLAVRNRGAAPILIPEGEVLVGAKQNRVANLTVLVPPLTDFVLPVSCVEAGRWHARSQRVDASGWANPKLRAAKVKSVWDNHENPSPMARPRLASDQHRVWREVAECASDLGVASDTGDLHESMRTARIRHDSTAAPVVRPELPAGTVGVVAVADGEVLGVDLWGAPEHLDRLWPRLWDSYLVDALRPRARAIDAGAAQVEELLATAAAAAAPAPTFGLGDAFRINRDDLTGTALVWQGQVQHLAAFAMA